MYVCMYVSDIIYIYSFVNDMIWVRLKPFFLLHFFSKNGHSNGGRADDSPWNVAVAYF